MSNLWFKNPKILLQNLGEFIPFQGKSNIDKSNAMARLAIYIFIYLYFFNSKKDKRSPYIFCVLILLVSYRLGIKNNLEKLANINDIDIHNNKKYGNNKNICIEPKKNNPFMNFTVGTHIKEPKREQACKNDSTINKKVTELFKNKYLVDSYDLFDRRSNERQFVTMPTTKVFNNQEKYRKSLYGGYGKCKSEGVDCAKKIARHNFRYDQNY